jgi:hypothetical protein
VASAYILKQWFVAVSGLKQRCSSTWFIGKMTTCQLITMTIPIMVQENDQIVPSGGPSLDGILGSTLNLLHHRALNFLEIKLCVIKTMIQRIFSPSSFFNSFKSMTQMQTLPKTLQQPSDVSLDCGLIFYDGCLNGKQVIISPSLYHLVRMVKLPRLRLPSSSSSSDY